MTAHNKILEAHKVTWEELDEDHIRVCINGYEDEYTARIEYDLFNSGIYAISRKYDKKNNKTYTTYKKSLK